MVKRLMMKRDFAGHRTLIRIFSFILNKYKSGTDACRTSGELSVAELRKSADNAFYHKLYTKQNRRSLLFSAFVVQSPPGIITSFWD